MDYHKPCFSDFIRSLYGLTLDEYANLPSSKQREISLVYSLS